MIRVKRGLFFLILIQPINSTICDAQSIEPSKAKNLFVEHSLEANKFFQEKMAALSFEFSSTKYVESRELTYEGSFTRSRDGHLREEQAGAEQQKTLYLMNRDYQAKLRKIGDSCSLVWMKKKEPIKNTSVKTSKYCCYLGDSHISQLLVDGSVEIKSAEYISDNMLKIEFLWKISNSTLDGMLTVNPDRHWTVEYMETKGYFGGDIQETKSKIRYEESTLVNGIYPPTFLEFKSEFGSNPIYHHGDDLKYFLPKPLPNEEIFWVSHYGIPEPEWANKPSKSYLWLWLIIGAVVISGIGFALRNSARNSARQS